MPWPGASGEALKINPVRIGLYDHTAADAIRLDTLALEQFEFPFEVVLSADARRWEPQEAGSTFLIFTDGAMRRGPAGAVDAGAPWPWIRRRFPEEYRASIGRITEEKTIPQIKQFVVIRGTVVTSQFHQHGGVAGRAGIELIVEKRSDGAGRALPREKFYIPDADAGAGGRRQSACGTACGASGHVLRQTARYSSWGPMRSEEHDGGAWFNGPETLESGWLWPAIPGRRGGVVEPKSRGEGLRDGPGSDIRGEPHATFSCYSTDSLRRRECDGAPIDGALTALYTVRKYGCVFRDFWWGRRFRLQTSVSLP